MVLSLLFAPVAATAGVSWLAVGLLGAGVLLLAGALALQGERLAALRLELDALRSSSADAALTTGPSTDDRPRFGGLYDEPEPSLVAQLTAAVRAQPVRVATVAGAAATIAGLLLVGTAARASGGTDVASAEVAQLRAAHDSLRTALAVIASGAATSADPNAALGTAPGATPRAPTPTPLAAARPTAPAAERPTVRTTRTPATAAVPRQATVRSPVPSAAILPPPPRLGAAEALPAAPATIGTEPVVPPKP